jgi:hypothetical protein
MLVIGDLEIFDLEIWRFGDFLNYWIASYDFACVVAKCHRYETNSIN